MKYPFIDIHTHRRTGEGIEVLSVKAGEGVPTTQPPDEAEAPVAMNWPVPPFSIGVHPWQLARVDEEGWLQGALREVEVAPAAAIGEIGLDFAVPGDYAQQKMVLVAQLRIAEERRLPVVLHCVRAFEPTIEILAAYRLPGVIFHGFVGSREQAARAVSSGYFVSLGERSLASTKTVEALATLPRERIFLETDEGAMHIAAVYAHAAAALGTDASSLAEQIFDNYSNIFGR